MRTIQKYIYLFTAPSLLFNVFQQSKPKLSFYSAQHNSLSIEFDLSLINEKNTTADYDYNFFLTRSQLKLFSVNSFWTLKKHPHISTFSKKSNHVMITTDSITDACLFDLFLFFFSRILALSYFLS